MASGEKSKARDIIAAIRTLRTIEQENRPATDAEKLTLGRFSGFGPVALSIFPNPITGQFKDAGWQSLGEELQSLLTPEEYDSTKRTTFNAFYTSPTVIEAIHQGIEQLGVPANATILEPGCGIGNFMRYAAPGSHFIGIEMDSISGRLANRYFLNHPEMVLGTWSRKDTLYGGDDGYSVISNGDLTPQIQDAISRLPHFEKREVSGPEEPRAPAFMPPPPERHINEGSFFVSADRVIHQLQNGQGVPVVYGGMTLKADGTLVGKRLAALVGLRDRARRVLQSQNEDWPEANRSEARRELCRAYDRFDLAYGPINKTTFGETTDGSIIRRMPNLVKFREDPDLQDCAACGRQNMFGTAQLWIRPVGFAHPVFWDEDTSPDDGPESSYATRAKLMVPGPDQEQAWRVINEHVRVHHFRKELLVTNRGPREAGYDYCIYCGYIEPTAQPQSRVMSAHALPRPSNEACKVMPVRNVVLGTKFRTDVLLISLRVNDPLTLYPGLPATDTALRTACEAIAAAACNRLQLEPGELRAEYRPALTNAGRIGREAEIYLYDTLPGGAGFSKRVGALIEEILPMALELLVTCEGNCDRSCYRCLRSFKNKLEHGLLDRAVGAGLLRYLLNGTAPSLPTARVNGATQLIYEDLKRQEMDGLQVSLNCPITIPGLGTVTAPIYVIGPNGARRVIAVGEPLCRDTPCDPALVDVMELSSVPVRVVSELLVRANLPAVTTSIIESLGGSGLSP